MLAIQYVAISKAL